MKRGSMSSNRSSIVSNRSSISSTGGDDQPQDDGTCAICQQQFRAWWPRHTCRNCGAIVCGDCSGGRVRLPSDPAAGKVRVCDKCNAELTENTATMFQEELEVNQKIIKEIKRDLAQKLQEEDASKLVLLELLKEATGDDAQLQEYLSDPQSPNFAFPVLRSLVIDRWEEILSSLEVAAGKRVAMEAQLAEIKAKLAQEEAREKELQAKKAELNERVEALEAATGERDTLQSEAQELMRAVKEARTEVLNLEMARRTRIEDREQRRGGPLSSFGSQRSHPTPVSSPRMGEPRALLISGSEQGNGRLAGCRRTVCPVM
mmetsp:Transcript_3805/g.8566  ORF Transcript_3805/g.8566 Transcript_3805/m.8566 type:complete len:317 (+) Transcript_3805:216-1166(+)